MATFQPEPSASKRPMDPSDDDYDDYDDYGNDDDYDDDDGNGNDDDDDDEGVNLGHETGPASRVSLRQMLINIKNGFKTKGHKRFKMDVERVIRRLDRYIPGIPQVCLVTARLRVRLIF